MEGTVRKIALKACSVALLPLVRWLLRNHMTHREFVELSKQLFVKVALEDYGLRGRQTNLSRVAIITGLDRKEVKRVRDELQDGEHLGDVQAPRPDRLSRVLKGWHDDADFLTKNSSPAALPKESGDHSFAALAKRYAGDVPVSAVLKELLNSGSVRENPDGSVLPLRSYYMPQSVDPQAALRSGEVLYDLGKTVVHNLYREDEPSRFEGRASNQTIPKERVPAFREYLESQGQRFLDEADAWLNANETTDAGTGQTVRLGVGVYGISGANPGQDHYAEV